MTMQAWLEFIISSNSALMFEATIIVMIVVGCWYRE